MATVATKREILEKASDSTHHMAAKIKSIVTATNSMLSGVSSKCKDATYKRCEKEIKNMLAGIQKPVTTLENASAVLYTKAQAIARYEEI